MQRYMDERFQSHAFASQAFTTCSREYHGSPRAGGQRSRIRAATEIRATRDRQAIRQGEILIYSDIHHHTMITYQVIGFEDKLFLEAAISFLPKHSGTNDVSGILVELLERD